MISPIFNQEAWTLNSTIQTSGIVTHITDTGFFIQDPNGDHNPATSDGFFILAESPADVAVGDKVTIEGSVQSYSGFGARRVKYLRASSVTLQASNQPLPQPVSLTADAIPTEDLVDAHHYYKSMVGMRVQIHNPKVVAPTKHPESWQIRSHKNPMLPLHPSFFVIAEEGKGASGAHESGVMVQTPDDHQPEVLPIDIPAESIPALQVGDQLKSVEGVLAYSDGYYRILADSVDGIESTTPARAPIRYPSTENHLTVSSYNAYNLGPMKDDPNSAENFEKSLIKHAQTIIDLDADIIALQEVMDDDGNKVSDITSAAQNLTKLVETIQKLGGPAYQFVDLPPRNRKEGGIYGGNIRCCFLYRTDRVTHVENSEQRLGEGRGEFRRTRIPVESSFLFNEQVVTLINLHLSAKIGSTPPFGPIQPPLNAGEEKRRVQAAFVNALAEEKLHGAPDSKVIILGDLNDQDYQPSVSRDLSGDSFVNLSADQKEYSLIWQGVASLLDHVLVPKHMQELVEHEFVHWNTSLPEDKRSSDHDPQRIRIHLPQQASPE